MKRFDELPAVRQIKNYFSALPATSKQTIHGEIFYNEGQTLRIEIRDAKLDKMIRRADTGLGLRLIDSKGRVALHSTSDLSAKGIKKVWQSLQEALPFSEKDPNHFLYKPTENDKQGALPAKFDIKIASMLTEGSSKPTHENESNPNINARPQSSSEILSEIAFATEKMAREMDSRIINFEKTSLSLTQGTVYLANSLGLDKAYSSTMMTAMIAPVASQGNEKEIGFGFGFAFHYDELQIKRIVEKAVAQAVNKLNPKSVDTGKYPILFDPEITASFLDALLPAFFGKNVLRGKSLLRDKLNQQIAASKISLINDPFHKDGSFVYPMDDEGLPLQKTELIKNGTLSSFLHNLYSAQAMNQPQTASAQRSIGSPPAIGPMNCYFQPEKSSPQDLLQSVTKGIFVNDVMGLHTINPITGDFSFGISGQWIDHGKITHPVSGLAMSGNLRELLFAIEGIANDLEFFLGGVGGSTLMFKDISISGA